MNIATIQTKTADGENFDREFMPAKTSILFSRNTLFCDGWQVTVPPGGSMEISSFNAYEFAKPKESPESDIEQARRERKA